MPPKKAEKAAAVDLAGQDVRHVSVRVEGLLSGRLDEPYFTVQVPGEDEVRTGPVLTQCWDYEGAWVSDDASLGKVVITRNADNGGYSAKNAKQQLWKTAATIPLTDPVDGERLRVIDQHRSTWEAVEVRAMSTNILDVGGTVYRRTGINTAFAFHAPVFTLENQAVNAKTVRELFSQQMTLKVMSKQVTTSQSSVPEDVPAVNSKDKKKAAKPAAKKGAAEPVTTETHRCVAATSFSFVPLCIGEQRYTFDHRDGSAGKARCALKHFPEFRIVVESSGGKFGEPAAPMTLLTEEQATSLMPLCVTVLSVSDVPDSRPISIHPSEKKERPLVDTIATQDPDYGQMKQKCKGVHVKFPIFPGAAPVQTPQVKHERNPGIYHHQLYLLGEIEQTTEGAIKGPLSLLRYIWGTDMRIELHDREGGAPGHGVADCSLRPLLVGDNEKNNHPTMKLALQMVQHRAEVADDSDETDGQAADADGAAGIGGDAPAPEAEGKAAADSAPGGSGVYLGQYMSWGTTAHMKIEMGAKLPRLSFAQAARQQSAAAAGCVGAVVAAALAVVDPSTDYTDPAELDASQSSANPLAEEADKAGSSKLLQSLKAKGLLRPRFAARGFEAKEPAPAALAQFSRLLLRVRYSTRTTRRVLHAVMNAITQCTRAGVEDDVKLFAQAPPEPVEVDEPPKADAKGKGAKAAKGGRPGTASGGKDPAEPKPDVEAPAADGGDSCVVQVSAGTGISGFEFIDDDWRVIVLEGMTTTTLQPILDAVHAEIHNMDLYSGDVSIVFNPHITFPARAYCDWPPLVPHAPPKPAKADLMDAGAVGNRIRRVRMAKSLQAVADTLPNYIKRRVSTGVLSAVRCLLSLRGVTTMQEAIGMGAFPTAKSLILLERMYGTTLSSYDVCGDETFYPLSIPLPAAYGMHDADHVDPEEADESPYGAVSPGGTAASHPSRPTTSFSSRSRHTTREQKDDAQDAVPAPTTVEELLSFVGRDVVIAGRPAPTHGRRSPNSTSTRKPFVAPSPAASSQAFTPGTVPGDSVDTLYLWVPDLQSHVLLLFSKMPRPVKPITVQVQGKIIKLEDGLANQGDPAAAVAIQVYRWEDAVSGGMQGSSVNNAYLLQKQKANRKLDYTEYRAVEKRRKELREVEMAKRAATAKEEEEGDSSGSECDLGMDVFVPPRLPVVETDYGTLNAASVAALSEKNIQSRRRQERAYRSQAGAGPAHPYHTEKPHDATAGLTQRQVNKLKADETAFSQLQGGWRPMVEEDVHPGIPVRVKRDLRKGNLVAFDKGVVTVEFPAVVAKPVALGKKQATIGEAPKEGETKPQRSRFAMQHLEVVSKTDLYDNRHPKKLPASRVADLQHPWDPAVANPFLRTADTSKDFKRTSRNTTALFSGQWGSGLNEPYSPPRSPHMRDPTSGGPPPVFHVSKKSRGHPYDKTKGMLFDEPKKGALVGHAPEAPPLSIYKPEESKRARPEVSTVYYAGKSHQWPSLENKNKPQVKPLRQEEKSGPVW
eukprot:TRINITY_DN14977_c0_g1_i1.p1 TRINITY_DN14977_c0_g1~~TRINITY_DN14977_c0_g1_i1.p1  ORF type:complete len:1505 (+),score=528.79 TRINITY_DN14977_c0_g1_i1:123-4637(+)